jgi:hypothetical protein
MARDQISWPQKATTPIGLILKCPQDVVARMSILFDHVCPILSKNIGFLIFEMVSFMFGLLPWYSDDGNAW